MDEELEATGVIKQRFGAILYITVVGSTPPSYLASVDHVATPAPTSLSATGGAAARAFPGALKRGLGRAGKPTRHVFKDVHGAWSWVGGSAISKALASSAASSAAATPSA